MESYGSGGGFPQRNSRPFNDPNTSGGNPMMPGAERMVQPVAHYANSNGILSRPGGGGPREDSVGGGGRAQQGDVFMVREASRGSGAVPGGSGADGRSPFATSGNRFQVESGEYAGSDHQQQRQALPPSQQQSAGGGSSSSHSSSHHRDRSERDRDKERDHHQQQRQLPLPKMLKIAVVGDSTSGKTAICNAFTSEGYNFSRNYHMTTGVSIYAKSIKLPSRRPGGGENVSSSSGSEDSTSSLEPRINLVLVDSAGKPIYRDLLPQYWDRLDGVALVLDLTASTALESALDWLSMAKGSMQKLKHVPPSDGSGDQSGNGSGGGGVAGKRGASGAVEDQPFLGVLIGSKTDLKDQRVISPKAAQDFASQHGLQYFECSAKENSGMEEPFYYLAHQWATSSAGPGDKENSLDGDVTNSSTGGIFAMNRSSHGGSNNSSSSTTKRSAFSSRQGSSSEAF